jgi:uncharacterized protein YigA (DUF484 family)
MSTVKEPQAITKDLTEESISSYLQSHPDFFDRHHDLLANLRLPHRTDGAAISLIERQVAVLRQKNNALERKLRDLIEVARSNEQLVAKIHTLATQLQASRSREDAVTIVKKALRTSFSADVAVLILFGDPRGNDNEDSRFLRVIERADVAIAPFKTFLEASVPRCGQIRDTQRDFLFGPEALDIGSAALVPLGPKCRVGFLAIGNRDADYFHPGKSMDFLSRLGDLVGCALHAD